MTAYAELLHIRALKRDPLYLTKRMRCLLERQFYDYQTNVKIGAEQVAASMDKGLTSPYDVVRSGAQGFERPTEDMALEYARLNKQYLWARVVENVFVKFRFKAEYDIMMRLYTDGDSIEDILNDISSSTFYWQRDSWLNLALNWAIEYRLL